MMPDDQVEKVEEVINRFKTHFKEIPWSDMLGKEMIHAGRLSSTITAGSPYEGILIGRMDAKSAETTYTHLKGILDEIVKLSQEAAGKDDGSPLSVEEAKSDLGTHARMMIKGYPGGSVLSVGYKGDLIIISFFGDNIVKDCMGLLKGDDISVQRHVTARALDGLFLLIGAEERKLRADPLRAGSALLGRVFGGRTR
jgi:hypothetical protein